METKTFNLGDKVFDIRFGWGLVAKVVEDPFLAYPIYVMFDSIKEIMRYTRRGKSHSGDINPILSHTEYSIDV